MSDDQLPTASSQRSSTTKGTKAVLTTKSTKSAKSAKNTKDFRTQKEKFFFAALLATGFFVTFVVYVGGQQLLDHVVARVGTSAITQTDVDAALAFGVIDRQAGDPVKQMIDRRLMLAEVNRFPPPEPDMRAIQELMAQMKVTAGANGSAVVSRTGVNDKRLAELARETLRIQSYMQQRFGNSARAEQQIAKWLTDLRNRSDVVEVSPPK